MRPAGGGAGGAGGDARPAGGGEPRPPQRARSRNLPGDARFALDALPALTTRPDQIKQLRQTILNLAVRGKLVPQDPNDEPASELLKRIARKSPVAKVADRKEKLEPLQAPNGCEGPILASCWPLTCLVELPRPNGPVQKRHQWAVQK